MKKKIFIGCIGFLLFFPACKREDPEIKTGTNDVAGNDIMSERRSKPKCDYQVVSSNSISINEPEGFIPLIEKFYKPGSNKLDRIFVSFRNTAAPGGNNPSMLKVIYQHRRMIFLRESDNDTAAVLNFDHSGRLTGARSGLPFYLGLSYNKADFRFFYQYNRLHRIENSVYIQDQSQSPPVYNIQWRAFVKLSYDHKKNVSKVTFQSGDGQQDRFIRYFYDYSRKANAQVYLDDMNGDHHYFFYFLKYLNIFPELIPENVLVKSFQDSEYPGEVERFYSHHSFDSKGKLTAYRQSTEYLSNLRHNSSADRFEKWRINWECLSGNNSHH